MVDMILRMVRARLNRTYTENNGAADSIDEYLRYRIQAAIEEMERMGIHPDGKPSDNLLIADYVCWSYSNRDKGEAMPDWLRIKLWERQMAEDTDHDS